MQIVVVRSHVWIVLRERKRERESSYDGSVYDLADDLFNKTMHEGSYLKVNKRSGKDIMIMHDPTLQHKS